VAVLRSGHPALRKKLTAASLADLQHLGISSSGENLEFVDAFLKARKTARFVASDVPHLSAGRFWCNRTWSPSLDASRDGVPPRLSVPRR
jgi:hypothetical protein